MTTHILKLPHGVTLCASALLCALVVALQQAEPYAAKLESPAQSLSELVLRLPAALRGAGALTLATQLTAAEKSQLATIAAYISPEESEPLEPENEVSAAAGGADGEPAAESPAHVDAAPPEPNCAAVEPAAAPAPAAEQRDERVYLGNSRWRQELRHAEFLRVPKVAVAAFPTRGQEPAAPAAATEQPAAPAPAEPEQPAPAEPTPAEPELAPAPAEPTPPAEPAPAVPAPAPTAAEPAPAAQEEEPPLTQAPPMRYRIMMVGDSLMEDLGPRTHRAMKHRKGLEFVVSAKFSTGLCRPDFFDWPAHMREVIAKRKPDLVIFFIGANDGLSVKEGKKLTPPGGENWRAAYARKMDELVTIARGAGAEIIWVEMPAIGGRYNKLLHETQKAQREYCESHGLISLRTDPLLSGEWGKFTPFGTYRGKTVRLRTKDDTHLTPEGNKKVLEELMPIIEQRLIAFYLSHPERRLSEKELAKIKSVPAIYTCQYTPPKKKTEEPAPAQP